MKTFEDGAQYSEVSFKKRETLGGCCKDIEFEECEFEECDFSGTRFQNCKFSDCEFVRCNLSLMDLCNSRFSGVGFQDSKLIGVDWTKAVWPAYHLDFDLKFERCILNDSSFFGLTLNELVLEDCKLHDVDFREGDFKKSTMICCDFTHSLFMRTNLEKVDFSDSTDYAIHVLENQVKGARFSRHEALNLLAILGMELVD